MKLYFKLFIVFSAFTAICHLGGGFSNAKSKFEEPQNDPFLRSKLINYIQENSTVQ